MKNKMKEKELFFVEDLMRMIYKELVKVNKKLQNRMISLFLRRDRLLVEIAASKENYIPDGYKARSLLDSSQCEVKEAMGHLKKAIALLEEAQRS